MGNLEKRGKAGSSISDWVGESAIMRMGDINSKWEKRCLVLMY